MSTEAGWHQDPLGRHEMRYWDGTTWTDHVSDAGVTSTDPADPSATTVNPTIADAAVESSQGGGSRPGWLVPLAVVAVLALIGGVAYLVFGGGDDVASSGAAELTTDEQVVEFAQSYGDGDAVRFATRPVEESLELVVVVAAERGDAVETAKAVLPDSDEVSDDEALAQVGFEPVSVGGDQEGDFEDLYEYFTVDENRTDGGQSGYFIAPAGGEVHFLVFDGDYRTGEIDFESESRAGDVDDQWLNDPDFYGEDFDGGDLFATVGAGAGLLGGLGDLLGEQLPGDLGDLLGEELPGDLGDLLGEDFDPSELEEFYEDFDFDQYMKELEDLVGENFAGLEDFDPSELEDLYQDFDFDQYMKELEDLVGENFAGLEDLDSAELEEFLSQFLGEN